MIWWYPIVGNLHIYWLGILVSMYFNYLQFVVFGDARPMPKCALNLTAASGLKHGLHRHTVPGPSVVRTAWIFRVDGLIVQHLSKIN